MFSPGSVFMTPFAAQDLLVAVCNEDVSCFRCYVSGLLDWNSYAVAPAQVPATSVNKCTSHFVLLA